MTGVGEGDIGEERPFLGWFGVDAARLGTPVVRETKEQR